MAVSGRAVVVHAPHDLKLETRETAAPGSGQVLVRVQAGGICGSDLHYYHHGGFGTVRIKAPMVLGHELAGVIEAVGPGVTAVAAGQRVALNPSLPCGTCENCRSGIRNHCTDMRFFGSAMRWPHVDGGFRDFVLASVEQAIPISDSLSFGEAAVCEPLAVCLHALAQAGNVVGKRVLITGAGPIGCLMAAAARLGGALDIVVTDILDVPLAMARLMGASSVLNTKSDAEALAAYVRANGRFNVFFECAGSAPALTGGLEALGPKSVCVLVGQGAEIPLSVSTLIGREIDMRGSFRFDREYKMAVDYLERGLLDVKPLITATLPVTQFQEAFDLASDKSRSMKVQLSFA